MAFYVREGGVLRATELTRGPWSAAHQHGGPPAALLAGTFERVDSGAFRIARVSVEFLKPVPLAGAIVIRPGAAREGRQVQRLEATLFVDGIEVARASALRLRREVLGAPAVAPAGSLVPPDDARPFQVPFFKVEPAYPDGVEMRVAEGRWGELPFAAWSRMRAPLVAGEPTSAIERALLFADAESGIGPPLDPDVYSLVNPDLTVYFGRVPEGEWIGLRVSSYASADSIGLAESVLFDRQGPFGRAAQSLLIQARAR